MHNLVKQSQLKGSWRPNNNNNNYGEDSLEIAPVDDDIFEQSDLQEKILDAEKKFSTSSMNTSHFASEYFEHPALYRVLFMGSVTEEKKKELFKKLSQGFAHVLQQQQHLKHKNLSLLGQPIIPFKEIKHNILLLSDDDDPNLNSDICEDIGVSMIEADFTWNSNAVNYSNDPNNLLLQYAWNQCPNPRELPLAWLENQIFSSGNNSKFTGYIQPEITPNGIDLCVYFYDGLNDENRTKNDLELLCLLRKLGIYVLPLTTTRDETIKSHFADLLTEYKVRCLDLGNLEVGQEPSFFHKKAVDRLSRLQGLECTQLNVPRVATYQILAVDQFCGIENNAIFQLLKRTRERQVMRDEIKEELLSRRISDNDDTQDNHTLRKDDDDNSVITEEEITTTHSSSKVIRIILLSATLFMILLFFSSSSFINTAQHWTVSFDINPDIKFTLFTRDNQGNLNWPENTPQVWLNHANIIPIEKVKESPGQYQLLFDPTTTLSPNNEKFMTFAFHVNTTITNLKELYPSGTTTFVLFNPIASSTTTTTTTTTTTNSSSNSSQYNDNNVNHRNNNKNEKSFKDDRKVIHNQNLLERIPKVFAFYTRNYYDLYKIIINNKN